MQVCLNHDNGDDSLSNELYRLYVDICGLYVDIWTDISVSQVKKS